LRDELNKPASATQIAAAIAVVFVFLMPMILLTVFPDSEAIERALGRGRIFIWWFLIFGAVFVYRHELDAFAERWERRRKR
jgi:hypothetical protein